MVVWEDKELCSLPYYHGYLPREDVSSILTKHGDFILRSTLVAKESKDTKGTEEESSREIVISILVDPKDQCAENAIDKSTKEDLVRNIVVHRVDGKVTIDKVKMFDDLPELITNYHQVRLSVDKKVVSLQRGVALCRWEFYHKHVTIGELLGRGAFGEVHSGTLKRKRKVLSVAVKFLSTTESTYTKHTMNNMMREARLMRGLSHPNIVKTYGVAVCEQPLYIILELVKGGSLDSYLKKHEADLDKDERLQMVMGACWGLTFLHHSQIIHRDVAARNCLYDENKVVKLSDFGLSRQGTIYKMQSCTRMPLKWLAPESVINHVFSQKTDVYSFGILIYEIFSCKESYDDLSNVEARKSIKNSKYNKFPDSAPKSLVKYVREHMWDKDPAKRANMIRIQSWLEDFTGLRLVLPNESDQDSPVETERRKTIRKPVYSPHQGSNDTERKKTIRKSVRSALNAPDAEKKKTTRKPVYSHTW